MSLYKFIKKINYLERKRQNISVNLIASENLTGDEILDIQSSIFSNKYAEGYPEKRYYAGCHYIDLIENLAISFAKKLFCVKYANVQPHSGSQANQAVYMGLCKPNDIVLGLNLQHGGHLTHGFKKNFSGHYYKSYSYVVEKKSGNIDYDGLYKLVKKYRPRLIIAGMSAYSRIINWRTFSEIARYYNCYLLADISHVAGLIATNLYPSPVRFVDVITTTVHKTLKGARGGIILTDKIDIFNKINRSLFPGIQGGPAINMIAAKALSLSKALEKTFLFYQRAVLKNAKLFSNILKSDGFSIVSDGTDTHLFLVDLKGLGITGISAEKLLEEFNIIVNKNTLPFDEYDSSVAGGIRIGTAYITARGFLDNEIFLIAKLISKILKGKVRSRRVKYMLIKLCKKFPIF